MNGDLFFVNSIRNMVMVKQTAGRKSSTHDIWNPQKNMANLSKQDLMRRYKMTYQDLRKFQRGQMVVFLRELVKGCSDRYKQKLKLHG